MSGVWYGVLPASTARSGTSAKKTNSTQKLTQSRYKFWNYKGSFLGEGSHHPVTLGTWRVNICSHCVQHYNTTTNYAERGEREREREREREGGGGRDSI